MLFTLTEIIHLTITILALGFIFSGWIKKPQDSVEDLLFEQRRQWLDWDNIKYAAIITAPAIVLHELAHKFVAIAYGYSATYIASFWGLGIGVVLRLVGSPFLFFLPGYVSVPGAIGAPITFGWIAFAGPLTNLILFFVSWGLLESRRWPKYNQMFWISKQINLLLFAFNMLPLPFLDGFKFYKGLAALIGL